MAKILCSYSSIEFSCEHLPMALSSREISHPLFHLPSKKLLSLSAQWSLGKLTHTESYLLYLSLLHSTGKIEWRTPAIYTPKTSAIIANNMEQLIHIIGKIDVLSQHALTNIVLPHFVMGQDTADLSNSYYWIQVWNQNYNEWAEGIRSHQYDQEILRRELSLSKLIKTPHKAIEDYPSILANWARIAADFPTFLVTINGKKIELADYWESIIIKCAKAESIFKVPESDLNELIEHCEDQLSTDGSIHALALLRFLRRGKSMQQNYLGLGDIDLAMKEGTSYRILSPETSAEDANIQNMIDNAPATEPFKSNYPSILEFVKAKARWNVAQTFAKRADEAKKLADSTPQET